MDAERPRSRWGGSLRSKIELPSLQTDFGLERARKPPQRCRPDDIGTLDTATDRVPLSADAGIVVRTQASRTGLRGLFNRSRSNTFARKSSSTTTKTDVDDSLPSTPNTSSTFTTMTDPQSQRCSSKKTARSKFSPSPSEWEPPPLFQAYPQAVKHALLQASNLSAEAILRLSDAKRGSNIREAMMRGTLDLEADPETVSELKKKDAKAKKHRRRVSGSFSRAEWTRKIYILVTSGYILQYAGEGLYDRLPEKILQLKKESVAFVSDLIPGKPFVLQIQQSEDGIVDGNTKFFSKFGFRNATSRRFTTCFFLVCKNGEELDSWLFAVKKEIEALGGKRFRPEEDAKIKAKEKARQQSNRQSRFMFTRPEFRNPVRADDAYATRSSTALASNANPHRRSATIETSESPSLDFATAPIGQHQTAPNTRVSSPAPSLSSTRPSQWGVTTSLDKEVLDSAQRRRSMQVVPYSFNGERTHIVKDASRGSSQRPHSTYFASDLAARASSPPLPNFDTRFHSLRKPNHSTPLFESTTVDTTKSFTEERPGSVLCELPSKLANGSLSTEQDACMNGRTLSCHKRATLSSSDHSRPRTAQSMRSFSSTLQHSPTPPFPPPTGALPAPPTQKRPSSAQSSRDQEVFPGTNHAWRTTPLKQPIPFNLPPSRMPPPPPGGSKEMGGPTVPPPNIPLPRPPREARYTEEVEMMEERMEGMPITPTSSSTLIGSL